MDNHASESNAPVPDLPKTTRNHKVHDIGMCVNQDQGRAVVNPSLIQDCRVAWVADEPGLSHPKADAPPMGLGADVLLD